MNIEHLRKFCLSLSHVTEDIKWEHDLCFSIGGKMFCVGGIDNDPFTVSFKVKAEEFEELVQSEDISPAPYLARYKWVFIEQPDRLTIAEWEHYLRQSYEMIKEKLPKKVLGDWGGNSKNQQLKIN